MIYRTEMANAINKKPKQKEYQPFFYSKRYPHALEGLCLICGSQCERDKNNWHCPKCKVYWLE